MENDSGRTFAITGTVNNGQLKLARWRSAPIAVIGIGVLLFLIGNLYLLQFDSLRVFLSPYGLTHVAFFGALGSIIILSGLWLSHGDISVDRYPRAVAWLGVGVAFLLLINAPAIAILAGELTPIYHHGWVISIAGTGLAAGAVVGVVEARSIERAYANQRLRTERKAAERHANQLDYLNSVLRHEVLNNVAIIKGYAELVLERDREGQTDEVAVIHRQCTEMADIITDVRVLIESLQDSYTLEAWNLADVIDGEAAKIRTVTAGEVEIDAAVPDDIVVKADELLPRVFRNLFSNAIDHNDEEIPRIGVSATVSDASDTITIRVADNGPGISPSIRETLFEQCPQADNGLGLYLVSELVERYGGDIELVETGSDGTTFEIQLHRATPSSSH